MRLADTLPRRLAVFVFITAFALLAAACGSEPAEEAEPELSMEEMLANAGAKLAAMTTATFSMSDETLSGAKFFGTTLKTVEGDIRSPDSVSMRVDVEAPGMGFVEIEIIAVGETAFMKFSRDAPWLPLPLEQVPFNFGEMGVTLSELLPLMRDPVIVSRESVGAYETVRIDGDILSEELGNLITSVDPGYPVTLSYWLDEADQTLRQLRIDGRIFNDDAPGTSRLVNMEFGVPVDIQLPQAAPAP